MGWLKPFSLFIFLRWRKTKRKWSLLIKFSFKIYASIERYGSYKFFIFFLKFYLILGTSWQNLIACWLGSHMAWQRLRGPIWYPHPWISKTNDSWYNGKTWLSKLFKRNKLQEIRGGEGEREHEKRNERGGRERENKRGSKKGRSEGKEREKTKRGSGKERKRDMLTNDVMLNIFVLLGRSF